MDDPKLAGTESLPTHQGAKVIFKASDFRPWLTQPKSRFDDRYNTCFSHGFIVISGSGYDVNMWIYIHEIGILN
jgi:hypothetical protein